MGIFSFFTDILIFLRTFTNKSFWVKFYGLSVNLRTVGNLEAEDLARLRRAEQKNLCDNFYIFSISSFLSLAVFRFLFLNFSLFCFFIYIYIYIYIYI